MKANTLGNTILFLLSVGCLVLAAGLLANSRLKEGPLVSHAGSIAPIELRHFLEEAREPKAFESWTHQQALEKRKELVSQINRLTGQQRMAISEEIKTANWVLEVLDLRTQAAPENPEQWFARLITAHTLEESIPDDVAEGLRDTIAASRDTATNALRHFVNVVHEQLRAAKPVAEMDLRKAVTSIELLDKESSPDLLKKSEAFELYLSMEDWLHTVREMGPPFRTDLGPADKLVIRRMLGLIQEGEQICDQCTSLGFGVPKRINEPLSELEAAVKESAESSQRRNSAAYQIWALENIRIASKYQSENPSEVIGIILSASKNDPGKAAKEDWIPGLINSNPRFRKKLGSLTGIKEYLEEGKVNVNWRLLQRTAQALDGLTGWRGQNELAKCLTRDLIEVRLLVIDEALLERPVANLYNETFERCWKDLEGTDHRVELAEASAKIRKRQPEEITKP